jgi:GH15 family glucan-1,4-alpha-glucosidase
MAYKKIGDYGVIGNGSTLALVGRDGALDWMCLPYMDSPSVFAALLDDEKGGRFAITPAAPYDAAQAYLQHSNILETRFRTGEGEVELTDCMVADGRERPDPLLLLRRVVAVRGAVRLAVECAPRFDYARRTPEREGAGNRVVFRAGDEQHRQAGCHDG